MPMYDKLIHFWPTATRIALLCLVLLPWGGCASRQNQSISRPREAVLAELAEIPYLSGNMELVRRLLAEVSGDCLLSVSTNPARS